MSLEASIIELNSSICRLIDALNARAGEDARPAASVPKTVAAGTPTTPAPTAPGPVDPVPAALDYVKDVQPRVLKVSATKGREAAVKLLGTFGLKSAKEAKPEQYADIIKACEEALK